MKATKREKKIAKVNTAEFDAKDKQRKVEQTNRLLTNCFGYPSIESGRKNTAAFISRVAVRRSL